MTSRLWLVVLLTALAAGGVGYSRGFGVAQSRALVLLEQEKKARAQDQVARAKEDRARAEALAEAERAARIRLQEETTRTARLAKNLVAVRQQIATERQSFNRRLSYVAENAAAVCTGLPFEWVGLYNEATRSNAADSRDRARGAGTDPAGTSGTAEAPGTARAGVQQGASLSEVLVTPTDILAHVRDYGGYCRQLEAQARSLVDVVTTP
ncbi:MAG: hypothetical protein RRY20_04840 [Bilophila sp.]